MNDNLIMWLVILIPLINVLIWCTFVSYLSWKSIRDEIDALDPVGFAFCCTLSSIAIPILISNDIVKKIKKRNCRKRMEGPARFWMVNNKEAMWFIITYYGKAFGLRLRQTVSSSVIIYMYPISDINYKHKLATLQEKHRCMALLRAFLKCPEKHSTIIFMVNGKEEKGIIAIIPNIDKKK